MPLTIRSSTRCGACVEHHVTHHTHSVDTVFTPSCTYRKHASTAPSSLMSTFLQRSCTSFLHARAVVMTMHMVLLVHTRANKPIAIYTQHTKREVFVDVGGAIHLELPQLVLAFLRHLFACVDGHAGATPSPPPRLIAPCSPNTPSTLPLASSSSCFCKHSAILLSPGCTSLQNASISPTHCPGGTAFITNGVG